MAPVDSKPRVVIAALSRASRQQHVISEVSNLARLILDDIKLIVDAGLRADSLTSAADDLVVILEQLCAELTARSQKSWLFRFENATSFVAPFITIGRQMESLVARLPSEYTATLALSPQERYLEESKIDTQKFVLEQVPLLCDLPHVKAHLESLASDSDAAAKFHHFEEVLSLAPAGISRAVVLLPEYEATRSQLGLGVRTETASVASSAPTSLDPASVAVLVRHSAALLQHVHDPADTVAQSGALSQLFVVCSEHTAALARSHCDVFQVLDQLLRFTERLPLVNADLRIAAELVALLLDVIFAQSVFQQDATAGLDISSPSLQHLSAVAASAAPVLAVSSAVTAAAPLDNSAVIQRAIQAAVQAAVSKVKSIVTDEAALQRAIETALHSTLAATVSSGQCLVRPQPDVTVQRWCSAVQKLRRNYRDASALQRDPPVDLVFLVQYCTEMLAQLPVLVTERAAVVTASAEQPSSPKATTAASVAAGENTASAPRKKRLIQAALAQTRYTGDAVTQLNDVCALLKQQHSEDWLCNSFRVRLQHLLVTSLSEQMALQTELAVAAKTDWRCAICAVLLLSFASNSEEFGLLALIGDGNALGLLHYADATSAFVYSDWRKYVRQHAQQLMSGRSSLEKAEFDESEPVHEHVWLAMKHLRTDPAIPEELQAKVNDSAATLLQRAQAQSDPLAALRLALQVLSTQNKGLNLESFMPWLVNTLLKHTRHQHDEQTDATDNLALAAATLGCHVMQVLRSATIMKVGKLLAAALAGSVTAVQLELCTILYSGRVPTGAATQPLPVDTATAVIVELFAECVSAVPVDVARALCRAVTLRVADSEAFSALLNSAMLKHPLKPLSLHQALAAITTAAPATGAKLTTLWSPYVSALQFTPTALNALYRPKSDEFWRKSGVTYAGASHVVNECNGVHFKLFPELPAREFAFRTLAQQVLGYDHCMQLPAAELFALRSKRGDLCPVLVSETVPGQTLDWHLRRDPSGGSLGAVDMRHYSLMVLVSIISNIGDAKPDDYIVDQSRVGATRIVPVDNDRVLLTKCYERAGWMKTFRKLDWWAVTLHVKCALFCLPQMDQMVDAQARLQFLQLSAEEVVTEFALGAVQWSQKYANLFGAETEPLKKVMGDNFSKQSRESGCVMDSLFPPGLTLLLLQRITQLQRILRRNPSATLRDVLQAAVPVIAAVYQSAQQQHPHNVYAQFMNVQDGYYLQMSDPGLASDQGSEYSPAAVPAAHLQPQPFDLSDSTMFASEMLQEWQLGLTRQVRTQHRAVDLVQDQTLSQLANLHIQAAWRVSYRDMLAVTSAATSLHRLVLSGCEAVNEKSLSHIVLTCNYLHTLIVRECPLLEVLDLSDARGIKYVDASLSPKLHTVLVRTRDCEQLLVRCCPKMRELKISSSNVSANDTLTVVDVSYCVAKPSFEMLTHGNIAVPRGYFRAIFNNGHNLSLERLAVWCRHLTGGEAWVPIHPPVTTEDVSATQTITYINQLLAVLPYSEMLYVICGVLLADRFARSASFDGQLQFARSGMLLASIIGCNMQSAIQFRNNGVCDEDCVHIAHAMVTCGPMFTAITLHGNNIGASGAQDLARGIRGNAQIEKFSLSTNAIGDEGVAAISAAMAQHPQLHDLDLRRTDCGDYGAICAAEALKTNQHLRVLYLSFNPRIGAVGLLALAEALQVNKHCAVYVWQRSDTWTDFATGVLAEHQLTNPRLSIAKAADVVV